MVHSRVTTSVLSVSKRSSRRETCLDGVLLLVSGVDLDAVFPSFCSGFVLVGLSRVMGHVR